MVKKNLAIALLLKFGGNGLCQSFGDTPDITSIVSEGIGDLLVAAFMLPPRVGLSVKQV